MTSRVSEPCISGPLARGGRGVSQLIFGEDFVWAAMVGDPDLSFTSALLTSNSNACKTVPKTRVSASLERFGKRKNGPCKGGGGQVQTLFLKLCTSKPREILVSEYVDRVEGWLGPTHVSFMRYFWCSDGSQHDEMMKWWNGEKYNEAAWTKLDEIWWNTKLDEMNVAWKN